MLDCALAGSLQLVYAQPINPPPHGRFRNVMSRTAKRIAAKLIGNRSFDQINSFRLVDGEIARTLAAYCGSGVYLDVALFWVAGRVGQCPVRLSDELFRGGSNSSGYSYLKLLSHFWRLLLTAGVGPLRLITLFGFGAMGLAALIASYAIYAKFTHQVPIQGWTSLVIVVAFFGGSILTALGIIAEYLAVTMGIAMGKPLYVVATKPTRPPLRR
jgi:undecaprenyl-phosphate 4-deoxy-4-formamido-L-arabinose transferase